MGKYMSVVVGAVVTFLGILGLVNWWYDFLMVLKGSIPVMLIFGGIIAVIAGISEMRDEESARREKEKQ